MNARQRSAAFPVDDADGAVLKVVVGPRHLEHLLRPLASQCDQELQECNHDPVRGRRPVQLVVEGPKLVSIEVAGADALYAVERCGGGTRVDR